MSRPIMFAIPVLLLAGASVSAAVPRALPLLPLTQRDQDRVDAVGCVVAFTARERVLFYAIDTTMTVRTRTGAHQCRFPEETFGPFAAAKGPITCGGRRLRLKSLGPIVEDPEADGSSQRMMLTIGSGRAATAVRGRLDTAC